MFRCTSQADICSWIKTNQEQIQNHPAWRGNIDVRKAEALLQNQGPFAYLLRKGDEENDYLITFIKEDQSFKHQRFNLEHDRIGWFYRNRGSPSLGPSEIISETLEGLIPQIMRCEPNACKSCR